MISVDRRELWIGSVFVVEWDLIDTDGQPIDTATVTGLISGPNNLSAAMIIDHISGESTYRASYQTVVAGTHGYKVTATGDGMGAIAGQFYVSPDVLGLPTATTDPTTAVGMVRLLAIDNTEPTVFTDAEIAAFIALEGGRTRRAAALALETIASNEALVSKKIKSQDISTDGPAVSDALLKRAKMLREQDASEVILDPDDGLTGAAYVVPFEPGCRW